VQVEQVLIVLPQVLEEIVILLLLEPVEDVEGLEETGLELLQVDCTMEMVVAMVVQVVEPLVVMAVVVEEQEDTLVMVVTVAQVLQHLQVQVVVLVVAIVVILYQHQEVVE
jgi:hypothetical protein